MAEYIDREDVYNTLKAMYCDECTDEKCQMCEYAKIMFVLDNLPIADVQPVDRWISVDEALPENDGDCLVWYKCDTAFGKSESWGIAHCSRCDWYTRHLNGDNIVVLYWMPMPEPPKQ